jgi:hypothetical protein
MFDLLLYARRSCSFAKALSATPNIQDYGCGSLAINVY